MDALSPMSTNGIAISPDSPSWFILVAKVIFKSSMELFQYSIQLTMISRLNRLIDLRTSPSLSKVFQ
uniref:Uncharacterized protein n=1 Tax=Lepeophtheirus salmonis TaxID=72036 RepID=A0A0K2V3F8_LEPSM